MPRAGALGLPCRHRSGDAGGVTEEGRNGGNDGPRWRRLMRAAQAGDAAAYRALLGEIAPLVRGRVRRELGGGLDPEDVVQDVLLSLHRARRTYDPDRPFLPWLMAIVRHRIADARRRRGREAARERAAAAADETFVPPPANWQTGVDAEALRRAVAALPASQRRAMELVKLSEMSLKDAAAASGMTVGALKVATHRALKALRAALGAEAARP
jgi:RNA polymerase sigma-70 factor (ECF subfamily)